MHRQGYNGIWRCVVIALFSGFICCFDHALAEYEVMVPEKVFAARNSDAHIPCMSNAPLSKMIFVIKDEIVGRTSYHTEEGDPNLRVLTIRNVFPEDSGHYECMAGRDTRVVELVVFVPTFLDVSVRVLPSNDVRVTWGTPEAPEGVVQAYNIYVTEIADSVGTAMFEAMAREGAQRQNFVLEDLKPGATYDIEVSAVYITGPADAADFVEGPQSPKVRVQTPLFNSPPVKVKAVAWVNSSILVTWDKPPNVDAKAIDGYTLVYKALSKKKNAANKEVNITSPDSAGLWKAILTGLRTRVRYEITLYAILNGLRGKKSQSIVFRHDGFAPELSIDAIALGPETVMVTLQTVGASDVKKLRVLYSDDTASKWTRIDNCHIGRHCVVSGLQPRSKYFFSARARVDRKSRHVVTHVTTLPTGLEIPYDVKVAAQTDHSIKATWIYEGRREPTGYVLMLDVRQSKEQEFRPFKQQVVFDMNHALVGGLGSLEQYRAKVVPFDADGMGFPSDTVLFSISPTALEANEAVTDAPKQKYKSPELIEVPDRLIQIDTNENVSLVCTAIGQPHPMVSWMSNGSVISNPQDRRNRLTLYKVQESMDVTCHAKNPYGVVEHTVHIDVSRGIDHMEHKRPKLAEALPQEITKKRGDPLQLFCTFNGDPAPSVTWYQDDRAIGQPSKSSSVLAIPAVTKSASLRCEGRNEYGVENILVRLTVKDTDVEEESNTDYSVSLRFLPLPHKMYVVKWAIDRGDLADIRFFFATVLTESGHVLLRQRLSPDQRQIRLQQLSPGVRYVINVKTNTQSGVVDDSTIDIIPSAEPKTEEPKILLEVVEIRHNRARVDFTALKQVREFRLRLKDLEVRQLGNIILNRKVGGASSSINLERLKPNNRYIVMVDATPENGMDPMSASLEFKTSSPGQAGHPVASRSNNENQTTSSSTPTATAAVPTSTTTTTAAAPQSSTQAPPASSDSGYKIRVKTANKGPYQVDIRWTVDRGDLAGINNFMVTIKSKAGQTLLQQKVQGDQRSITIQSLSESTQYLVEIQARTADDSVLAQSDLSLYTLSSDANIDTANPSLDFEANEIRSSRARLEWAVINGDPLQVSAYRLKVQDRDERGVNLLTQNMAANSQSINLKKLPSNRQFFVTVEALGRDGQVMMTSSLTFSTSSPGSHGLPVKASSGGLVPGNQQPQAKTTLAPAREPELEIEIRPQPPDGARLNWTIITPRNNPVRRYRIKVQVGDANGPVLLRQTLPVRTPFFTIRQLQQDTTYYIEMEAVGLRRRTLTKVSTTYLLPPPGHTVQPVRASSKSSGSKAGPGGQPAIVELTALGRDSVIVRWLNGESTLQSSAVMIKYAEFNGNTRDQFVTKYVPAVPSQASIRGLKAGARYGFQVGRLVPEQRYVQLSDLVFVQMPV